MLLNRLAEHAMAIRLADVPADGLESARHALLDTVGVTLAGANEDCTRILARASAPMAIGPATLFASNVTISPLDAALINGTAAHALDFDDCSNTMGGHPSAPIVPALFALAEREKASGSAMLEAYVTGFEVETKLGRAVNFTHYEKGWHPTSTLGTFGAAAACARLLDLDQHKFATALAIAASYEEPLVKLRFERRVAVLRDAPGAGRHTGRGQSPERRFGRDQMRLKALRSSSSTRLA